MVPSCGDDSKLPWWPAALVSADSRSFISKARVSDFAHMPIKPPQARVGRQAVWAARTFDCADFTLRTRKKSRIGVTAIVADPEVLA